MMNKISETFDFHPWDSEPQVGEFLASLIDLHGCKTVLEIGVFRGLTSSFLISKAKENYTGVDLEDYRLDIVKKQFEENKSWFIQNDSLTVLQAFIKERRKYDFIFIDSFHSYDQVSKEFYLCRHVINKNGIIVFHDSILHEGVKKFISEIKEKQKQLNIELITLNTPDIDGRGGASGITIVKFC